MEMNFALGKNGGNTPNNLSGKSISVGKQAVRQKIFMIQQLQFSEF